jgi:hypothetical protein
LAKRREELAKKPSCGLFVTLRLDQDVQYIAFAVYSTPQPILLPVDWKDNFVQIVERQPSWPVPTTT